MDDAAARLHSVREELSKALGPLLRLEESLKDLGALDVDLRAVLDMTGGCWFWLLSVEKKQTQSNPPGLARSFGSIFMMINRLIVPLILGEYFTSVHDVDKHDMVLSYED